MKNIKYKILLLLLLLLPNIVFAETSTLDLYGSLTRENIQIAIFIEIFVTIHMSVFVLKPLAKIINEGKKTQIFIILFILRVIILVIGTIKIGLFMAIIDFISVFIGAFLLIPLLSSLKHFITGGKLSYREHSEVSETEFLDHGIKDPFVIENKLTEILKKVEKAKSNKNYEELNTLCSETFRNKIISNIELYNEQNLTNITEITEVIDAKIVDIFSTNISSVIDMLVKVKQIDYIVNDSGKVIRGSSKRAKRITYKLKYRKRIYTKQIKKYKCENCGAPIDELTKICNYCSSPTNIKFSNKDWILDERKIIK